MFVGFRAIGWSCQLIAGLIRAWAYFRLLVNAAKRMHGQMLEHVVRSPLLFFDSNPAGRILNRFSKVQSCLCVCDTELTSSQQGVNVDTR